jgi:2-keto-4-pentenoate hydratase/2-oxohepta-3-ene-1,7-dioic acid hydratase in catechol pathway
MVLRVNGTELARESSGTLYWKIADLIRPASLADTDRAGEILGTGTIGNGSGAERPPTPPTGDIIELEATGLGLLRNRVVAP